MVYAVIFNNLDAASSLDEISFESVLVDEMVLEDGLQE